MQPVAIPKYTTQKEIHNTKPHFDDPVLHLTIHNISDIKPYCYSS